MATPFWLRWLFPWLPLQPPCYHGNSLWLLTPLVSWQLILVTMATPPGYQFNSHGYHGNPPVTMVTPQATQLRLEELNKENAELQSHVLQLKNDKEFLAGTLTKVTCELSR